MKHELGGDAEAVHFADMAELGRNPACIIPAWHDFVAVHGAGGASAAGYRRAGLAWPQRGRA